MSKELSLDSLQSSLQSEVSTLLKKPEGSVYLSDTLSSPPTSHNTFSDFLTGPPSILSPDLLQDRNIPFVNESDIEIDVEEFPSDIFLSPLSHSKTKTQSGHRNGEILKQNTSDNLSLKQKAKSKAPGGIPLTLDLSEKLLFSEKFYPEYLIPPENFQMVTPFIYRSGFPKKKNFPFLKSFKIKTILTLILEDYPEQNIKFSQEFVHQIYQFGVAGNKEPFVDIPENVIRGALSVLLDKRNHPILIHCNKGKHRTGCLVGCVRKMQGWSLTSIFDEYRRFACPKARAMDQQFIELFNIREAWCGIDPEHLPEHFNYPKWCPPFTANPELLEKHRVV